MKNFRIGSSLTLSSLTLLPLTLLALMFPGLAVAVPVTYDFTAEFSSGPAEQGAEGFLFKGIADTTSLSGSITAGGFQFITPSGFDAFFGDVYEVDSPSNELNVNLDIFSDSPNIGASTGNPELIGNFNTAAGEFPNVWVFDKQAAFNLPGTGDIWSFTVGQLYGGGGAISTSTMILDWNFIGSGFERDISSSVPLFTLDDLTTATLTISFPVVEFLSSGQLTPAGRDAGAGRTDPLPNAYVYNLTSLSNNGSSTLTPVPLPNSLALFASAFLSLMGVLLFQRL